MSHASAGEKSARSIAAIAAACVLCACSRGPEATQAPAVSAAKWQTLFDGTSLKGWTMVGDANWRLVDGTVEADSGTGFLLSNESYSDFDLDLEFFVSADANSGVFIRCGNRGEIGAGTCYEVNIFDERPDPTYRTGAIVDVAKPSVMIDSGEHWNHYEISARGNHLVVKLNDQMTVDTTDDKLIAGPFALQYGAGRVVFRNVRVRTE
jgi:3-keto-disaccharide hydrolase